MHIHILGTSHVSSVSVRRIRQAFEMYKPTLVAVELDDGRLEALEKKQKSRLSLRLISEIGVKGFIFALFAQTAQQTIGRIVKMQPGADMLCAVDEAKKHGVPFVLIDRPIGITLKRLSRYLRFRDVWRFVGDGMYGLLFPKRFAQKYALSRFSLMDPDASSVESALTYMKNRFPGVYRVLVDERNHYMIKQLQKFHATDHVILVVVGAGHVPGMKELLEKPWHTYTVFGANVAVYDDQTDIVLN